ncbi:bifunctional MaoC family dehydratase N-terminal/OB-fold nucleic acid binding domain-containing protein [Microbispora sp. ATCC PTA-5024]|uniref:bifunctional MaoC family dehydratase N-terminal/OB-fold nucleic acid binding domain-containing protein n=1 Tax=Microbispora sp. ATCC PTA-5024 TaxID=316330 RepID=UPI0003DB9700|nr:bifunctional MaoC family dehydratase N-terminal/OB-fold nucleic acid binding domain-containing protein [Microbispora sp. ATCC PTA-5024]ETK31939.1 DNA-binding protein [Microbispora sp. ATCC PTA-5024]
MTAGTPAGGPESTAGEEAAEPDTHGHLMALADKAIGAGEGPRMPAPDPVNPVMIRHWAEAMGDANPRYAGPDAVAPPAMIQVWTMAGPGGRAARASRTPLDDLLGAFDETGYTGVVATNCEHTYHRYLRPGEHLTAGTRMTDIAGPKRTALGEGYFVTWTVTWYSQDEPVAEMLFRLLKFRPRERPAPREPYPLRPAVNRDTAFFWEGARLGELRVQTCAACGLLRHPPGPVCPSCHSAERAYVVARGEGTVYSYVVHHHPPVPGLETPFAVAVVELPEGVRIVGNVVGCPPSEVSVGMPVRVEFREMDDELTLPMWVPGGES